MEIRCIDPLLYFDTSHSSFAQVNPEIYEYCRLEDLSSGQIRTTLNCRDNQGIFEHIQNIFKTLEAIGQVLNYYGDPIAIEHRILLYADNLICADTQLPAYTLLKEGLDIEEIVMIAQYRILNFISEIVNIIGASVTTFGLSESSPDISLGALGLAISIVSNISKMHLRNTCGSALDRNIHTILDAIKPYRDMIYPALKAAGFSEIEIDSILDLPRHLYGTERHVPNLQRISNVLMPLGIAISMLAYKEPILAIGTLTLGILSFPLGEQIYHKADKVRAAMLRAAHDYGNIAYLEEVQRKDIRMNNLINLISELDQILTALLLFIVDEGSNILATISGLRYGLQGLKDAFFHQKYRELATRIVQLSRNLIDTHASSRFILTRCRWVEHINAGHRENIKTTLTKGIIVHHLAINLLNEQESQLPFINLRIASGKVAIITARSGWGKSTLAAALQHVVEHSGDVYVVTEAGKGTNVHNLSPSQIKECIIYISRDAIGSSDSIVDLFNKVFQKIYPMPQISEELESQFKEGINIEDSLLKAEIDKYDQGELCIFDEELVETLRAFRFRRMEFVNNTLKSSGGNLTSLDGERTFKTLSSGEQQRLIVQLSLWTARTNSNTALVILDEPLSHLDTEENLKLQLKAITEITRIENAPATMIISHPPIDDLQSRFDARVYSFGTS